jgi:nitrogen fixation-related uncharacterized protein
MATWKKVVVSGSGLEQLDNTNTGYITSGDLPTVNDSTITLLTASASELAGSEDFTLNQASDETIKVFSGQYDDLAGIPTIPTVNNNTITLETGSASELAGSEDFTLNQASDETIKVFSGQYDDLAGIPTPPTVNDNTITLETGSASELAGSEDFTLNQASDETIKVFSGQYDDLAGIPTIPTVNNNTITLETGSASELAGSEDFTLNQASDETIKVFSGQYDDLAGIPTPPTVNDNTITLETGSASELAGSEDFTLNQASDETIKVFSGQYDDLGDIPSGLISASAEGTDQGQIKLNGVDINVKDMGIDDSPEFTNLTVSGNLSVAGTASFKHSQNLDVADQYITMNSGSGTGGTDLDSGGIIVAQNDTLSGELFGWLDSAGDNDGTHRWAVASNVPASETGNFTAAAYMSAVLPRAAASTKAAILTLGGGTAGQGYNKVGNIFTGEDGDIWIYSDGTGA